MPSISLLGLIASVGLCAPAPWVGEPDLSVKSENSYIGNIINAKFSLKIEGPPKRTWEYKFTDDHSGTAPVTTRQASGTYQIAEDLAVFTGKGAGFGPADEVRFAFNYGRIQNKVLFSAFFPIEEGKYRFHQRWYEKREGQWQPKEDRVVTLTAGLPPAQEDRAWKVRVVGQRTRWDAQGKSREETFDKELFYQKQSQSYAWHLKEPPVSWVPSYLAPVLNEKKQIEVLHSNLASNWIGAFNGFIPVAGPPQE
jgi:hypothetical protein